MKPNPIRSCAILAALASIVLPLSFAHSTAAQAPAQAQPTGATPDDPKFAAFVYDVVSIKPYKDNMDDPKATMHWVGSRDTPDGFTLHNAPMTVLIAQAYRTEHSRLSGTPAWANTDHYEIEAKMDSEVTDAFQKLSPADQKLARQHMLRVLARDYLKLTFHMEVTEVPIYEMVVGKNGPKLKAPADPTVLGPGIMVSGNGGVTTWDGKNVELSSMLGQLGYVVGRPVYDKTGLTGRYDFQVKYATQRPGAGSPDADTAQQDAAPPIATALEEQLGLKLVSGKGPMDMIVIDHMEKPVVN
jgi:uncharacterized protein (TIGR03435 family)